MSTSERTLPGPWAAEVGGLQEANSIRSADVSGMVRSRMWGSGAFAESIDVMGAPVVGPLLPREAAMTQCGGGGPSTLSGISRAAAGKLPTPPHQPLMESPMANVLQSLGS